MIEILKQALKSFEHIVNADWRKWEELASPEEFVRWAKSRANHTATSLRQAIAEAEKQEPVAWIHEDEKIGYKALEWKENVLGYRGVWKKIPLYTHPQPKREWVGLTQQDIDIAFDDTQEGGGFWEFADAIEAKLKQKNGYAVEKNT